VQSGDAALSQKLAELVISKFEEAHYYITVRKAASPELKTFAENMMVSHLVTLDFASRATHPDIDPRLIQLAGVALGLLAGAATLGRGSNIANPTTHQA
jgi:hypothetical protein